MSNQFCNLNNNQCECRAGYSASANGQCKLDVVLGASHNGKNIGVSYLNN